MVSEASINYAAIADRIVRDSLAARSGENAVVVTDGTGAQAFVASLATQLALHGVEPLVVTVPRLPAQPHGYLTWDEPPVLLEPLFAAADIAVVYMSTLIALSRSVQHARSTGTRFLFVPADYDLLRPAALGEDLDAMAALGSEMVARLLQAASARVTTAEGTEIEFGRLSSPFYDDARAQTPGDLDFYPGGMWNVIPDPDSVNGTVVFAATLFPVGQLAEPVRVTFERGRITEIAGGWQARAWERWLRSFDDARIFEFSHLSGGLAAAAGTIGHDWEDLIRRGGILISGGENVLYGGHNQAQAHFDGALPDATLHLDGELVLDAGRYRVSLARAGAS